MRELESSPGGCACGPLPAMWRGRERAYSRSAVQRDPARRGAAGPDGILCQLRCTVDLQWLRRTAPHEVTRCSRGLRSRPPSNILVQEVGLGRVEVGGAGNDAMATHEEVGGG